MHSLHQTPPSPSILAALSSRFPHPGTFGSRRVVIEVPFPPQTRHTACHRLPCGPGTTPRSIGETEIRQPGQVELLPKRGKVVVVDGALFRGCSHDFFNGDDERDVFKFPGDFKGLMIILSGVAHYEV